MAEIKQEGARRKLFSCLGCVIAGPLGCGAFFLGALTIFALLLPSIAANYVEESLPGQFEEAFAGQIELSGVDLSWTRTQRLEQCVLRDDEGGRVLEASLEFPSMLDLLDLWAEPNSTQPLAFSAKLEGDLRIDANGQSNLERAFVGKGGSSAKVKINSKNDIHDLRMFALGMLQRPVDLRLEASHLYFSDLRTDAGAAALSMGGLDVHAAWPGEQQPVEITAKCLLLTLGGSIDGRVVIDPKALRGVANDGPGVAITLNGTSLPSDLCDTIAGTGNLLEKAFGASFDLRLEALDSGDSQSAPIQIDLDSNVSQFAMAGEMFARPLLSAAGWQTGSPLMHAVIHHGQVSGRARNLLGEDLPEGLAIEWLDDEPLVFNLEQWRFGSTQTPAASSGIDATSAGLEPNPNPDPDPTGMTAPLSERLTNSDKCRLFVKLPSVVIQRQRRNSPDYSLPLNDSWVGMHVDAKGGMMATLRGTLFDASDLVVQVASNYDGGSPLTTKLELQAFPTSLMGQISGQGQLWRRAFGDEVSLEVFADLGREDGGDVYGTLDSAFTKVQWNSNALTGRLLDADAWQAGRAVRSLNGVATLDGLPAGVFEGLLPPNLELTWPGTSNVITLEFDLAQIGALHPDQEPNYSSPWPAGILRMRLPNLDYQDLQQESSKLQLADLSFDLELGEAQSTATIEADLVGDNPGEISGSYKFSGGLPNWDLREVDFNGTNMPTGMLDAVVTGRSMLGELFGPRFDIELVGRPLGNSVELQGQLSSDRAQGQLQASFVPLLEFNGTQMSLEFPLSAELGERLAEHWLPFLDSLEAADALSVARLSLRDFRLPLNGLWHNAQGRAHFELGAVRALAVPALMKALALEAGDDVQVADWNFEIDAGVASFERLTLLVAGEEIELEGRFDLSSKQVHFAFELPLSLLRQGVSAELDQYRRLLNSDYDIPMVMTGRSRNAKVDVSPEFLELTGSVLKGMLPDAVKRAVELLRLEEAEDSEATPTEDGDPAESSDAPDVETSTDGDEG